MLSLIAPDLIRPEPQPERPAAPFRAATQPTQNQAIEKKAERPAQHGRRHYTGATLLLGLTPDLPRR